MCVCVYIRRARSLVLRALSALVVDRLPLAVAGFFLLAWSAIFAKKNAFIQSIRRTYFDSLNILLFNFVRLDAQTSAICSYCFFLGFQMKRNIDIIVLPCACLMF